MRPWLGLLMRSWGRGERRGGSRMYIIFSCVRNACAFCECQWYIPPSFLIVLIDTLLVLLVCWRHVGDMS